MTTTSIGGTIQTATSHAVKDVSEECGLLERWINNARVIFYQKIWLTIFTLPGYRGIKSLWREGHGALIKAKREPVSAELFWSVELKEFLGHWRLDSTRAGGLLVHKENVVVSNGSIGDKTPIKCIPQRVLDNAVEEDVVLTNELVDSSIVTAPPIAPLVRRVAATAIVGVFRKSSTREGDRSPKGLSPNPDGKVFEIFNVWRLKAPRNVARHTVRQERLACSKANSCLFEFLAGFISVLPVLKDNRERRCIAFWLDNAMSWEGRGNAVKVLAVGILYVDNRLGQSLLNGRGNN